MAVVGAVDVKVTVWGVRVAAAMVVLVRTGGAA